MNNKGQKVVSLQLPRYSDGLFKPVQLSLAPSVIHSLISFGCKDNKKGYTIIILVI